MTDRAGSAAGAAGAAGGARGTTGGAAPLPSLLANWQNGTSRAGRASCAHLQQACISRLVDSLAPAHLKQAQAGCDKIFASVWLDAGNVLLGTKCNELRLLHLPSLTHRSIAYPEQPVHRAGPDLLARANAVHCGQHALALSPSGTFLATGGAAAEDVLLWQLSSSDGGGGGASASSSSRAAAAAAAASRLQLQPLQTFMGHADWVFDVDWLSDRHWVSAGRDRTIKLWQVPDAAIEAAAGAGGYDASPGAALLSVRYHADKVRAICYDHSREHVVALSVDGCVSWWSQDLRLQGSCCVSWPEEPCSLAVQGPVAAVGGLDAATLLDTRIAGGGLGGSGSGGWPSQRQRLDASPGASRGAGGSGWLPPAWWPGVPSSAVATLVPAAAAAAASAAPQPEQQRAHPQRDKPPALEQQPARTARLLSRQAAALAVARVQPFERVLLQLQSALAAQPAAAQQQQLAAWERQLGVQDEGDDTSQEAAWQQQVQHNLLQQMQQAQQAQAQAQAQQQGPGHARAGSDAGAASDDGEFDDEYDDDGWSDDDDGRGPALTGPIDEQQLPNQLRYLLERTRDSTMRQLQRHRQRQRQPPQAQQAAQQQQAQLQGTKRRRGSSDDEDGGGRERVQARLLAELKTNGQVRSLSFHAQHLLCIGSGSGSLVFYDLRRLSSSSSSGPGPPGAQHAPWLGGVGRAPVPLRELSVQQLPAQPDPVLVEHWVPLGRRATNTAVYSHAWSPCGTRLLSAGGALELGYRGAFITLWS